MGGNWFSEIGKNLAEEVMSTTAVVEAKQWFEELLDAEHRGRKDRDKSARYRLAKRLSIPESYLFRLQYKTDEMKDVRGSIYRTLMLAHRKYVRACEVIEDAARAMERERREIEEKHATNQGPVPIGQGENHARN